MAEADLLYRRLRDLADKAAKNSTFEFSDFLSTTEYSDFLMAIHSSEDIAFSGFTSFGGYENAERKMLRFGDVEELGYEIEFPIVCIKVSPLIKKFSDEFSHRDFLGAVMNLGIDRAKVGDIIVKDKEGYIFANEKIAEYILQNLEKVKHTHIKTEIYDGKTLDDAISLLEKKVIVASERIDAVLSKLFNMSRSTSIEYFREKKVFVNSKACENNSYILKAGDIVSVRGFGKFIYAGISKQTKSGRQEILVKMYE